MYEFSPLKAFEIIKNAPTIYVGCASDIYTRYSFECKEIEKSLKAANEIVDLYNKWIGYEISDFEFFTLLNDILHKYDLIRFIK